MIEPCNKCGPKVDPYDCWYCEEMDKILEIMREKSKDDIKEDKLMKVFVSVPMHGYSDVVVREEQQKHLKELELEMRASGMLKEDERLELIDTVSHPEAPKDSGRLWYLGEAIKKLEDADLIFFAGDWYRAKGCWTEFAAAAAYGKKMIWSSSDFDADQDFRDINAIIKHYLNSQEVRTDDEASDVSSSD